MAFSRNRISKSDNSRSTQTRENEERRRQEELAILLTYWSDDSLVVDSDVSRRLYERERDCELTLSGSLDLVKQNPSAIWDHVADALQELHIARLKLQNYDQNKICETLNIWRGLVAFDKERAASLALALTSFGRIYCSLGRYADAEEACLEATNLYRDVFARNPQEGRESSFFTMICLTEVYCSTSRFDDAERALRMAMGFLKKISAARVRYEFILDRTRRKLDERSQSFDEAKNYNLRDEALNYCRNASRLWRWGSLQEAEDSYLKAIAIYRDPASADVDLERRACLADALDELGRLYCQPKFAKYEEAEERFVESVSIQRELSSLDSAYSDSFATALLNLASYYEHQKRGVELEQTLREALDVLGANDGGFNPIVPSARVRLANLLRRSNRAEEAIEEYRRALELWDNAPRDAVVRCRAEIALTRFRAAELHKRAKRWDEAEESYEVAQRLFRELNEKDGETYAHKLASSLNNLATLRSNSERGDVSNVDCLLAEKNYCEASTLYRRLYEKDPDSVGFEFATALYNSALLHEKFDDSDKAEKEYLEALEIQRELAKENPKEFAENVARTLNNLAVLYRSNASDSLGAEKAEPLYEEALRIYESLERERPKVFRRKIVRTLRNLASVHLRDLDRKELAEEEYRRAVTLLLDLIKASPDVASYKSDLADVHSRLGAARFESGSFQDAKQSYLDALTQYKELTRVNPRKYSCKRAETFDKLSEIYQALGAYAESLQARESVVRTYEEASREEPNDRTLALKLATANYRLALTRQKLGQDEDARDAYRANLSILNDLSQGEPLAFRLDRARTYNNLAIISQKLNRIEDAEVEYETAVGLYRELETDEPGAYKNDLTKTFNNLAALYQASGRFEEAEKNLVAALAIRRELAEENPQEYKPFLAISLFNLSNFYSDQGRLREAEANCREAVDIFRACSDDESRRNFERASTKLRGIRDEIEEREIKEAFVEQSDELPLATMKNVGERVAYVYVSSIGDDMNVERDFLAQEVFPRLKLYCKRRDVEFVLIDLRRGTEVEVDDARVLALGLQEIERTRPFFIGLLGDEYGQILPLETLEQNAEFKRVVLDDRETLDPKISALEAEFQFGVMRETRKVDAFFALRSAETEAFGDRRRREKAGTEPFKKLTNLKRKLREQKLHPTSEYKSFEELGEQIERALRSWIDRLFDVEPKDEQTLCDEAQRTFAERLRQNYEPRQADYDALDSFASSVASVLMIVGSSSAGKSSLLANWSTRYEQEKPNRRVATYYVGADDQEDAPSNVLRFLTQTLASDESALESSNVKATLEERARVFSEVVANCLKSSEDGELIVVVDGLDRLVDVGEAKDLTWLPRLPKRAKYVLSTSEGDFTQEVFIRRGWDSYELTSETQEFRRSFLASAPFDVRKFADRSDVELFDALFARFESAFDGESAASSQDFAAIVALLAASSHGLTLEELLRASGFSTMKLLSILNVLNCALTKKGDRRRFANASIRRFALERYEQNASEARRRLIELCVSDDELARSREISFQCFQLGDRNALKESLFDVERFLALYDGTKACEFCKYWDAVTNDGGTRPKFDRYFDLKLPSTTNEEIGSYWRALGDAARSYGEFQAAENAYRRALDSLRESRRLDAEYFTALTRLSSLCREQERYEDAERELREGLLVFSAQNASGEFNSSVVSILVEISVLCRRLGRLVESEKLCSDAASLAESSRDERGLLAPTLESARLCFDLRRFDQAQAKYEDALNLLRDLVVDNPFAFGRQIATTLSESARAALENERYEDAEARLQEAESICRKTEKETLRDYDFELASTLDDYARLFYQTNRLEEADEKSREAASIWRELASKDARFDEKVASTLEFSAKICFDLEEYEDSEDACRDALEVRRKRKEYREIARCLYRLGRLCRRRDDQEGAERDWLEARDVYRELATKEQNDFAEDWARLLKELGGLYLSQDALEKAEENYCDALVLYRRTIRKESERRDLELTRLLDDLGGVCWKRGRVQDAEVYYREALEGWLASAQENPRESKRRVAEITRRLAFADLAADRTEDAERELTTALELEREFVCEESKNADDELAEILCALGNIHFENKRLAEAEAEYQEALEIRRRQNQTAPERYEREVVAALVSLATLHRQVNRLSESDAEFQIALETCRDLAEKEPRTFKPKLAFVLKNLAELHDEFNRKTKADVEFNEAAAIYREINDETPNAFENELVATLRRWAEFCQESNRPSDAKEKYREIASIRRRSPIEMRNEDYFDALAALAETLTSTDEKEEASNVYRELVQAFCQKGALEREKTLRLADALNKSARLRFDAGEYELVASEYEALATISRALAASDFDLERERLQRALQALNAAYEE